MTLSLALHSIHKYCKFINTPKIAILGVPEVTGWGLLLSLCDGEIDAWQMTMGLLESDFL